MFKNDPYSSKNVKESSEIVFHRKFKFSWIKNGIFNAFIKFRCDQEIVFICKVQMDETNRSEIHPEVVISFANDNGREKFETKKMKFRWKALGTGHHKKKNVYCSLFLSCSILSSALIVVALMPRILYSSRFSRSSMNINDRGRPTKKLEILSYSVQWQSFRKIKERVKCFPHI